VRRWRAASLLALVLLAGCARAGVPTSPDPGLQRGIAVPSARLRGPDFPTMVRWLAENGFDHLRVDLASGSPELPRLLDLVSHQRLGLLLGWPEPATDPEAVGRRARRIRDYRGPLWLVLPAREPAAARAQLAALRREDASRVAVVGPALLEPRDPNLVRGFELRADARDPAAPAGGVSEPSDTSPPAGAAGRDTDMDRIAAFSAWASRTGRPVHCLGFGIARGAVQAALRDAYYDERIAALEQHGISWTLRDAHGHFDVLDAKGYLIPGVMAALGRDRPRPQDLRTR